MAKLCPLLSRRISFPCDCILNFRPIASIVKWQRHSFNGRKSLYQFNACIFSLLGLVYLVAADLDSDTNALLAFRDGLQYSPRVNWTVQSNACTWEGVACSPNNDSVWSLRLPGSELYGQIAPGTLGRLSDLRILSLRSNLIFGPLPDDLANCTKLRSLYLQHNSISGPFPSFGPSRLLNKISLSFNKFNGTIPESLNALPKLTTLLLQNNSFTGSLPILNLPGLLQFSVAYNHLNGSIPRGLEKFKSDAFSGNQLCGGSLFPPCRNASSPSSSSPPSPSPHSSPKMTVSASERKIKKLSTIKISAIVIGDAVLLIIISLTVLACSARRDSSRSVQQTNRKRIIEEDETKYDSSAHDAERSRLVFLNRSGYRFNLEDLFTASAEVLGKGSLGASYKAVLENGSIVVVKRLKDVVTERKEFEHQMEMISKFRHRCLVPVRAYFYSKKEKLLVLDYSPIGSLALLLHGTKESEGTLLDWDTRLKIALTTSQTITCLHEQGGSKFSHGNIKSSNILLNRDYRPCVSDFGLVPLCSPTIVISRMVGYMAPEVTVSSKVTHKSDVYSFGVLLLELLTGKAPSETLKEEGVDLPGWVQSVVREEWTSEVFDLKLMCYENIEEEMVQLLQIAMSCVAIAPDQRPKMAEVTQMIEGIRQFEIDDITQSSSDKSKDSNGTADSVSSEQNQDIDRLQYR